MIAETIGPVAEGGTEAGGNPCGSGVEAGAEAARNPCGSGRHPAHSHQDGNCGGQLDAGRLGFFQARFFGRIEQTGDVNQAERLVN